ncbi:hypothetical protein [Cetobacterium sp.]|uniref:hypothetical protein n=1 Tax=Cetobacterium sp. TaxID=2071632 RepID=UPI002FCB5F89
MYLFEYIPINMWKKYEENYNVQMSKKFLTFSKNFTNVALFRSKNWKEKKSSEISFDFLNKIVSKIELIKKEYPNKKIIFIAERYDFFSQISDVKNEDLRLNYNNFINQICQVTKIINASNFIKDEINKNDYFIIYLDKMYNVYNRTNYNNQSIIIYFAKLVNSSEKKLNHYEKCEHCHNDLILQELNEEKYIVSCNKCNYESVIDSKSSKYKISKCNYCHSKFIQKPNEKKLYCSEYCSYNFEKELRKKWEEDSYYYDEDECQPEGANPWD